MAEPAEQGGAGGSTAAAASASNKRLHIKSLVLSGFRSYSESKITNLSAKHNCIVGPNGSGKSNFFAALEFVLGEREFANLSHEDRQMLLHEGGGQDDSVLMAYVEVTFDNSEGRLPLDTDEVKLRRSVGLKKDEFFVNNKHVQKAEVSQLLESAGFSRSNPYYICRQGKVAELCTMTDAQRLQLLKEVAGTIVYDTKRKESEKLLEESVKKSKQIDESIQNITTRLNELQQEKEELEQFRELDRKRRAVEFVLYDAQHNEATKKVDALEAKRGELVGEVQNSSQALEKIQEEVEALESSLSLAQESLDRLESEKKTLSANLTALSKTRTRRELDVRDLEERVRARTQKLAENKAELAKVEHDIAKAEDELDRTDGASKDADGVRCRLGRVRMALSTCRDSIQKLEEREAEIRSKQGRTAKFGSDVNARNAWIDQEIEALRTNIESKEKAYKEYQDQRSALNQEKARLEQEMQQTDHMVDETEDAQSRAQAGIEKARQAREAAVTQRKELWKAAEEHEDKARKATEELKRAQNAMNDIVPMAFHSGLRALDEICQAQGIDRSKVYGPLLSLIRCEKEAIRTAVEVAAGQQLLHVVVDTDGTAAELMKGLLDKRAGRLTFKPLNVLAQREQAARQARSRHQAAKGGVVEEDDDDEGPSGGDVQEIIEKLASDPEVQTGDALPLITMISYEEKFAPAVRAMLGRTLLCRNHRVASLCSKKYNVDCVLITGDIVNRRGAVSGGFVDTKRSRLTAYEDISRAERVLADSTRLLDEAKAKARREDQEVTRLTGEIDKLDNTRRQLEKTKANANTKKSALSQSLRSTTERLTELEHKATSFAKPTDLVDRIKELEVEKKQPPLSALKTEEKAELAVIPAKLDELRNMEKDLAEKEATLNAKVMTIKSNLDENLRRRREELVVQVQQGGSSSASATASQDEGAMEGLGGIGSNLESAKRGLDDIKGEEEDTKAKLDDVDTKLDATRKEVSDFSAQQLKLKERERKASETNVQAETELEKVIEQRGRYLRDREAAARKIRELGALQPAELEQYRSLSKDKLGSQLQKINTSLKKFAGINKKALEQFVSFSEKKQTLVQRQKETREADAKIRDLIEHLDRAKDDAIMLTFKQLTYNFREIFSELIPDGVAQLRMVRGRREGDAEDDDDVDVESDPTKVSAFTGVSPRVSFSGSKEPVPMKQLSGGQKALVALTLIFAIQRCDPAPFYLFDEIDQALDSNHRTAVANLIQRQARSKRSAQFITTTFRPELVEVADKCFGIQFAQKVSTVGLIDKDQARKFVKLATKGGSAEDEVGIEEESAVGENDEVQRTEQDDAAAEDDAELSASAKKKKKAKSPTVQKRSSKKRRSSARQSEDEKEEADDE